MAIRCPNCGNEISPGETFCGQCGTPNMPPAQPTEMVNSQSVRDGLLNSGYNTTPLLTSNPHNSGMQPPAFPSNTVYGGQSAPSGSLYPNQPDMGALGPRRQTGFYRDATEAMSSLPANNSQNFQMGYPQQPQLFVGVPAPGGISGAAQRPPQIQPFQASNSAGPATMYPPSQPFTSDQNYQRPPDFPSPRQKKQNNIILIIACICLAIAVISVAALGAIYLQHNNSSKAHNKTTARPTSAVTTPTVPAPSPTLSPTAASTPSPTPSPSPSVSPTVSVDPGFTQCAAECVSSGFQVEYPNGWAEAPSQDPNGFGGEQFSTSSTNNPSLLDVFANFKSAVTTVHTPEDLLAADLNTQFANQQNYIAPTSSSNAWIDGAKWLNEAASFQLNNQTEDVEVFAIVYQQRSYIIELQAPDSVFNQINAQDFEMMLGKFQFQQPTS
ncbi:MAG TPA: zinc-ribbon domain-containing protein [Ktedonobacteraceae bacterium]|nr:zinc-ribbon domain-containing protein [Ktedonobacteraceae bacterium]